MDGILDTSVSNDLTGWSLQPLHLDYDVGIGKYHVEATLNGGEVLNGYVNCISPIIQYGYPCTARLVIPPLDFEPMPDGSDGICFELIASPDYDAALAELLT